MAVIVTADDDPDILTLFGLAAARGGHSVLPASDGRTALRLLRQHHADLGPNPFDSTSCDTASTRC